MAKHYIRRVGGRAELEFDRSFEALDKAGLQTAPTLIGSKEIDYLMTKGYAGSIGTDAGGSLYWRRSWNGAATRKLAR
jgi:hypothetical protein